MLTRKTILRVGISCLNICFLFFLLVWLGIIKIDSSEFTVITPKKLTAIAGLRDVTLEWESPSFLKPSAYNIYQDDVFIGQVTSKTIYYCKGLEPRTSYNFYVKAFYGVVKKESWASNIVNVSTTPASPRNLRIEKDKKIIPNYSLHWEAPLNMRPDSYKIYGGNKLLRTVSANQLSYTLSGGWGGEVAIGQTYHIKAYYNGVGESSETSATLYLLTGFDY